MFEKPLFYYDPTSAGGAPAPETESQQDLPDAGGNGGQDDKQAELDRQFAARASRAAEAERKKLFEALGMTSQDEFDAFVKAKKEAEDAQKTEIQKWTEAAQKAQAKADKLEADSVAAIEAAHKRIVDGEIKLLAMQPVTDKDGKVTRPPFRPDALDIVIALVNRQNIRDEEGKLTGIAEALDALAKEKSFLLVGDGKPQAQSVSKGTPAPATPKPGMQTQPAKPQVVVGTTL